MGSWSLVIPGALKRSERGGVCVAVFQRALLDRVHYSAYLHALRAAGETTVVSCAHVLELVGQRRVAQPEVDLADEPARVLLRVEQRFRTYRRAGTTDKAGRCAPGRLQNLLLEAAVEFLLRHLV